MILDRLRQAMSLGIAAAGLGLAVLLAFAWFEHLTRPGISLVDGYWIGRTPWTPLGVILVLAGSALAVLAGSGLILVRGDWLRRILVPAILALPAFWWLTAMGVVPMPRFRAPDPVTLAYSLPESAALALLLPALVALALALAPLRGGDRVRLRPIHRDEPAPRAK